MKKLLLSLFLVLTLTGCSYNGKAYFGEDGDQYYLGYEYFGEDVGADEKFLYKDAYQTDEDYLLDSFNVKPVSTRNVEEVKTYDFITTSLAMSTASNTELTAIVEDTGSTGSSSSDSSDVASSSNINDKNGKNHKGKCLGTFTVTAYCSCHACCAPYDPHCTGKPSKTASGVEPKQGYTIATDWDVIDCGTKVVINNHIFEAQDKGGAIDGYRIDIYYSKHSEALKWGRRNVKVYAYK